MITYVILTPGDVPVGYIRSDGPPSLEAMANHLAVVGNFVDRDALLLANPGLTLGYCVLQ
jgi:hypothetical protein